MISVPKWRKGSTGRLIRSVRSIGFLFIFFLLRGIYYKRSDDSLVKISREVRYFDVTIELEILPDFIDDYIGEGENSSFN